MKQRGLRKFLVLAIFMMATFVFLVTPSEARKRNKHSHGVSIEDASSVIVSFTGVEVMPKKGKSIKIKYGSSRTIDLMDEGVDISGIIFDDPLESREYKWIRLKVEAKRDVKDSYIVIGSDKTSLWIPSGKRIGLKIGKGFSGGDAALVIDFDVEKSIRKPKGDRNNYILKSTLKLERNNDAYSSGDSDDSGGVVDLGPGSLNGTVAFHLIQVPDLSCRPDSRVYLFTGLSIEPDDQGPSLPNPVATAAVLYNLATGTFTYDFSSVAAGDYTAAYTCQAANDDSATDNPIPFSSRSNVTIAPAAASVVNFQ
jgi:hypothetical protein